MKFSKQDNPALILIDIQKAFNDFAYWGGDRNNPQAEDNAALLLKFWRQNSLPIFHIKHCSSNPSSPMAKGHPGNSHKEMVMPEEGEPIITKNVNSAFIGTNLKQRIDEAAITKLVIVGLTTDHCVSTTTRMAGNYGYDTYLVHDATATFNKTGFDGQVYPAQLIHDTALASLNNEFATIISAQKLVSAF